METEHVTLDSFPEYLTASDFARYLCVTVQTLRNMEKSKRVPLADIGGGRGRGYRKRWRKATIQRWEDNRTELTLRQMAEGVV